MKIQIELQKLVKRTDIWREGEFLDLWSVPHLLSGALLACMVYLMHLDFWYSSLLALLLLIAYEIFEIIIGIWETKWNRIMDVVVGMTSFVPVIMIIQDWAFLQVFVLGLFIGLPDAVLSYIGWSASHKAKIFEQKIKQEYDILRVKFLARMKTIREKREEKLEKKLNEKAEKIAARLAMLQLKKKKKLGLLDMI